MQVSRLFAKERGESRTDVAGLTTNQPNSENIREAVVRQEKRTGPTSQTCGHSGISLSLNGVVHPIEVALQGAMFQ